MKLFYDTKFAFPYICISKTNNEELHKFIHFLKGKGVTVTKFYEEPRYAASDGFKYDYLLRLAFDDEKRRTKPDYDNIHELFNEFTRVKSSQKVDQEHIKFLESEEKYFKQIKAFLDSERKILEVDRQYLREQLELLNTVTKNLKRENNKISKLIVENNKKISDDIQTALSKNSVGNKELLSLEAKLKEKEGFLEVQETDLKSRKTELEKEKKSVEDYRNELELQYEQRIKEIKEISLGIESSNDDSIQDLRIMIFGDCKVDLAEIREIFSKSFYDVFGEEMEKSCIEAKYLSYKSVKNSNITSKVLRDKFDYIIIGPHDHSVKGKSAKKTFTSLKKEKGLKAKVFEDYQNPLTFELLKELSAGICKDWDTQFEEV